MPEEKELPLSVDQKLDVIMAFDNAGVLLFREEIFEIGFDSGVRVQELGPDSLTDRAFEQCGSGDVIFFVKLFEHFLSFSGFLALSNFSFLQISGNNGTRRTNSSGNDQKMRLDVFH